MLLLKKSFRLLREDTGELSYLILLIPFVVAAALEALAMMVLYFLPVQSKALLILLDLGWTVLIVLPAVGFGMLRPLIQKLERRRAHAHAMERIQLELEEQIRERTDDLSYVNQELIQEIAERKAIAQDLRDKERRLELVLRQLPVMMWAVDLDLNVTWIQGAGIAHTGLDPEAIVGKRLLDFTGLSPSHPVYTSHQEALSGHPSVFEAFLGSKTFQFLVEPLVDLDGKVIGCAGVGYDLTDLKKAERQILIQNTALQSDLNAVAITDVSGNIVWANQAFTEITGYPVEEALGKNMRILKSGHHDGLFFRNLWGTILKGNIWSSEMVNRRKDGDLYYEHQVITPVLDEQGEIAHFISIKMDITPRKKTQQELKRRNQELELLNEFGFEVSSILEPDSVLETTALFFSETMKIDAGFIFLHQEEAKHLQLVATWRLSDVNPTSSNILISEYHNSLSLQNPDTEIEDCWPDNHIHRERALDFQQTGWSSYLCIPLQAHNRLLGVIKLLHKEPDFFKAAQSNFYHALGIQIGVAVQNARLFQAEMKAREHAQLFRRAGMSFSASLNMDTILDTLLNFLNLLLDNEFAYVTIRNGEKKFTIEAAWGDRAAYPAYLLPLNLSNGANSRIHEILSLKEGLLIPNTHTFLGIDRCLPEACLHSWLVLPLFTNNQLLGFIFAGDRDTDRYGQDQLQLAGALVNQATVAIQNAWLFEQVSAGRDRAKSLSQRLVSVQETERRNLARELHDETSQSLASLLVGLELLRRSASDPAKILEGADKLELLVNDLMDNMHRIAVQLRPASLDQLGLISSLRQYIEVFQEINPTKVQFETFGIEERFPPEIEITIFRIVQEALTNVARHSRATQVDVLLNILDDKLTLIIEDNGIGFDPAQETSPNKLGLIGIRERAEVLGGSLLVETAPQAGLTLKVELPWKENLP
jgi:PAS domain S-box-containing protein